MSEASRIGKTVLFVSHQLGMLAQLCNSCLLLEKGALLLQGETEKVIEAYISGHATNNSAYHYDENNVADKNAYIIYQKVVDENGLDVAEITNENPIILETKIRIEQFQNDMELSLSLQNRTKGRIFTVNIPLKQMLQNNEKEKIIKLEIPANFIAPNRYSWISSIHIPGSHLIDVLWDECNFFIKDVGTAFARYDGGDYGCILLNDYKVYAFDN